ncbi:MAG TPA: cytochrome P450, partial [Ilumatobacteraceae bacterium]|nr:cytochrome P450 [Ilumatobacteraceae bacterium]
MEAIDADLDPFAALPAVDHDGLRELRERCPVARIPVGWYLSSHATVSEAPRHVDTFVASFRQPGVVVPDDEKFINEISGPRHGRVRKVINAAVAHHRAARLEPMIRQITREYLQPVVDAGHGELIEQVIAPIPINVIAHLIGVPAADWPLFRRWSDEVVEGTYPTMYRNERGEGLHGAHPEFTAYIDRLIAERRSADTDPDDLLTRLLTTEIEGRRLNDVEVRTQLVFLIISGNETTRHLIGNLIAHVAGDPDLYQRIRADRSLIEPAIEEVLRLEPPIHVLLRNVEQPTDMFGPAMQPGQKIIYGIAAAYRDPQVFDHPDDFVISRDNARDHMSFGGGPHVCPGSALARLEAKVVLDTLADLVGEIELNADWKRR